MAKVDWINWKSNKEDIIDPIKVNNTINDITNNYKNKLDNIISNELTTLMEKGGLSRDSVIVDDISPLYLKAYKLNEKIDELIYIINKFNESLIDNCTDQRKLEKEQLIEAIEGKIKEEEKKLENSYKLKEKINSKSTLISMSDVDNIIELTLDRIKKLKNKLEEAKSL